MPDSRHGSAPVVAPSGRLDAAAAPDFRRQLNTLFDQGHYAIIINLAHVLYMSSSALRVLLLAHRTAQRNGGQVVLCSPQPLVLRVIHIIGFDQVFAIYDNEEAAQAALAVPTPSEHTRRMEQ